LLKKKIVEVSDEQWRKIRVYAAKHDLLIKETIEAILKEYFKDKDGY